ncbi:uroporphyrinogen-III synthase [Leucobacter sp. HNU]|uniref:uroporphyrinogen-III synthase n=1 Tax=Leucobacter sp. HNU TaxID=3236805 RepID=UPI003A811772
MIPVRRAPLPLTDRRILLPRGGVWGERVAAEVRRRGGVPVTGQLIELADPDDAEPLRAAVEAWNRGDYEWLAVTSANAAAALVRAGARPRADSRVAVVGPSTAEALQQHDFRIAVMPARNYSGEGLATSMLAALGAGPGEVLLPVSDQAGTGLEEALRDAGHWVSRVTAYRTVEVAPDPAHASALAEGGFDAVLVTSGSVARALAAACPVIHAETRVAAIGGPTAQALVDAGLRADTVAPMHTVDGLLDALSAAFALEPTQPFESTSPFAGLAPDDGTAPEKDPDAQP